MKFPARQRIRGPSISLRALFQKPGFRSSHCSGGNIFDALVTRESLQIYAPCLELQPVHNSCSTIWQANAGAALWGLGPRTSHFQMVSEWPLESFGQG